MRSGMVIIVLLCPLLIMVAYAGDTDNYSYSYNDQIKYIQCIKAEALRDVGDKDQMISCSKTEINASLVSLANGGRVLKPNDFNLNISEVHFDLSKPATRYIPIRWIELHTSRHPECQNPDGSVFRHSIPASDPSAWRSSEYMHWMISRMNDIYSGTGIQFWLQSHEIYATEVVADFLIDKNTRKGEKDQLLKTYTYDKVSPDIFMVFPHADISQLGQDDSLRRERWLQKAVALYDDPHGMPVFVHSDYKNGKEGDQLEYADDDKTNWEDFVLPQHGYFPWDSPGMAFLFLSCYTWADNWRFAPEITPAHELGHALGNLHTLDFDYHIGKYPAFPDGSSLGWADYWDLSYVNNDGRILGFESRLAAEQWIASHGIDKVHRIDYLWNIILDKNDGRMSAELDFDPAHVVQSNTMVPCTQSGTVRLLQGLSFDLDYTSCCGKIKPFYLTYMNCCGSHLHQYSWQRNIMSYRHPDRFYTKEEALDDKYIKIASVDPYDHMTARFSQSQIELMQKQLQGSTKFTVTALNDGYGTIPAGKESYFASRFSLLGDGRTEDFVWYSNGEGSKDVNHSDRMKNMIAFRAAPAGSFGLDSKAGLVSGDFNGDKLKDLLWYDNERLTMLQWSRVDLKDMVHHWDKEFLHGADKCLVEPVVCVGDFDANGADDIFMMKRGDGKAKIAYFKKDPGNHNYESCLLYLKTVNVGQICLPLAVGNFDGCNGDDIVWASYPRGATHANFLWSDIHGSLVPDLDHKVGDAKYEPYPGNFNGISSCDILWYNPTDVPEILWRDSSSHPGRACQTMQAIHNPTSGVDKSFNIVGSWQRSAGNSIWPRLTIGDFDGNGADDIMVRDSHEPNIYFSKNGDHSRYEGSYDLLQVALHNSGDYLTAVGEFDSAVDANGKLGDDIYLYYCINSSTSKPLVKCPSGKKCCKADECGNCLKCVGIRAPCYINVKCPEGFYCQRFDDDGNCKSCGPRRPT